jgi:hypothetical protein
MTTISRTAKLEIIFSAIAIAVGIGITLATVYNQTLAGIFHRATSEDNDNNNPSFDTTFGFTAKYKTIFRGAV